MEILGPLKFLQFLAPLAFCLQNCRSNLLIASIFNDFNAGAGVELLHSAAPAVILMLAGYVLHFLPSSWNSLSDRILGKSGVLGCAIVIAFAIWAALQASFLLPETAAGGLPIYANF